MRELAMRSLRFVALLATSIVFSSAFLNLSHAQSPNVTVSVTGSGASIDEAKADAIRQALQQTVMQLVVVDRAIRDNTILRDKVMSTMNGYIEKFQQREIKRSEKGYEFTAEITVSASRIENFIGITTGGAGPIEGDSLLAEQNRRRAQIQAEQLQAQARGEIFDRIFRGFPSDAIDIKVLGMKLSDADLNILQINIEYAYKPTFVTALESTLQTLALRECIRPSGKRPPPQPGVDDLEEAVTREARFESACWHGQRRSFDTKRYDAVCLGYPSTIKCFALPPGSYCASCLLKDFIHVAGAFIKPMKGLLLFGRFVDVAGQSANTTDNCLVLGAMPDHTQSNKQVSIQTFIARDAGDLTMAGNEKLLVAGFDFKKKNATINLNTSFVDLTKAKYFVAVPALTDAPFPGWAPDLLKLQGSKSLLQALEWPLIKLRWVTNLVPDTSSQARKGCELIDEAVQRQLLSR